MKLEKEPHPRISEPSIVCFCKVVCLLCQSSLSYQEHNEHDVECVAERVLQVAPAQVLHRKLNVNVGPNCLRDLT
jgi:hypothetical protein